MKKKTLTTIILIVALAMVAAVTVYAVANYGTKEDPLVTSSYLQDVVQPRMEDAYRSTLDGEVREMEDQFADQVAAAGGSYVLVTLESGQTLTGRAGTELLMRHRHGARRLQRRLTLVLNPSLPRIVWCGSDFLCLIIRSCSKTSPSAR